jgi:cell wall-associated NlpC family hydrolase
MRFRLLILYFVLLASSCRSVKNLGAKDGSSAATTARKPGGKREFINGIEVTPGGMVANTKKSSGKSSKNDPPPPVVESGKPDPRLMPNSFGMENANMLQFKYAIATDATAEKLTNIPLLQVIDKWWGTRYCMGGVTDDCLDCSAFTQIVMRDVYQLSLPRTAQEQYNAAEKIELEDLREGDLVFFNTGGKGITHVGVYMINNKFVHAATSGGVMISDLNEKYWQPKFRGAGRVVKAN